jgi:hypothetical protein
VILIQRVLKFSFSRASSSLLIVAILFTFAFFTQHAEAACTSPAAPIGSLDFQTSVFKYCDGTNWVAFGTGTGDFLKDGSIAMTGTLKANVGTAALPGYTFTGFTGTGMFETGTNILGLSTAGVERARIDASGNLLISSAGSTPAAPRTIGFGTALGEAVRWQLSDDYNAIQAANNDRTQIYSYWGVDVLGNRGLLTSPAYVAGSTLDPSLNVYGGRTTAPTLAVTPIAAQTANMQEWRNSAGTHI